MTPNLTMLLAVILSALAGGAIGLALCMTIGAAVAARALTVAMNAPAEPSAATADAVQSPEGGLEPALKVTADPADRLPFASFMSTPDASRIVQDRLQAANRAHYGPRPCSFCNRVRRALGMPESL